MKLAARYTLSIVSNSIYNIDSTCFEEEEPEILKVSLKLLAPPKNIVILMSLTSIYPFLSRWLKLSFSGKAAAEYFTKLMDQALEFRLKNKIQRIDYLDHLLNLRNKKEISGE